MKALLPALFLLIGLQASAQKDSLAPQPIDIETLKSNDGSLTRLESAPRFPGGEAALMDYLAKELRYPDAMRQAKVQGVVNVAFTITDAGDVSDVQVRQGIPNGQALNDEAVRVVKAMPKWEPARVHGVTVPMGYVLPVKFELGK